MTRRRVEASGPGVFGQLEDLIRLGYRWEPLSRRWLRDLDQAQVDALIARTQTLDGVTARLTRELVPGALQLGDSPWYLGPVPNEAACDACRGALPQASLGFAAAQRTLLHDELRYAWFHPRCAVDPFPAQVLEVLAQYTAELPERRLLERAAQTAQALSRVS